MGNSCTKKAASPEPVLDVQKKSVKPRYTPIRGSEIRLVRFGAIPGGLNEVPGLHLQSFEIGQAPPYLALSYWWGNPELAVPITLNEEPFSVTPNLYQALRHISILSSVFEEGLERDSGRTTRLYLWIDALCINQEDVSEKARQIPRMTEIYSTAFTVLIWLGSVDFYQRSDDLYSKGFRMLGLKILLSHLEKLAPPKDFEVKPWTLHGDLDHELDLGNITHALYRAYLTILTNPWFNRVWTIQERCVSRRDPCVLIGPAIFSLQSLYLMKSEFQAICEIDYRPIRISMSTCKRRLDKITDLTFGQIELHSEITSSAFLAKPLAVQLLTLLMSVQGSSSVPHDQVYSLLGLLNLEQLPKHLFPSYEQPYDKVCRDYTRYLIESTGDLRILSFEKQHELSANWPSWVMDLRYRQASKHAPHVSHTGYFSEDGRGLIVEGVNLGIIKCIVHFPQAESTPPAKSINDETESRVTLAAERLLSFYKDVIIPAAQQRQQSSSVIWKEWFSDFIHYNCNYPLEFGQKFDSAYEFLDARTKVGSNGRIHYERDDVSAMEVLLEFSQKQFALLSSGWIVQCVMRVPIKSSSWCLFAFKGSESCSIVSELPSGDWQLGGCIQWDLTGSLKLDEEFFSKWTPYIQKIKLV